MCGRYTITETEALGSRYHVDYDELFKPNFNAAPTQNLPVVTEDGNGKRLQIMRWGLIPAWAKGAKIGYKLINARSETVFEKPMWKRAIVGHRCLIPAIGFYEWQKREGGGKQPFYIHPYADYGSGIFSFAGVWSVWHDPASGKTVPTYSILTTAPNKEMSSIHDRMPVILHSDDENDWLNPDMSEERDIAAYLRPLDDGALETYEVSPAVNAVKVNDETLVLPINSK